LYTDHVTGNDRHTHTLTKLYTAMHGDEEENGRSNLVLKEYFNSDV